MAIAALIIAILAFLMAAANLIIYLAKGVFSTHTIQYVSAESMIPGSAGKNGKGPDPMDSFEEFNVGGKDGPMEAALKKV